MALGDSCTFSNGYWKLAYAGLLDYRLNALGNQRGYEVINAGIEGYNSEQALSRLKEELLQYTPDMVILYIGWNDLMKVNPSNVSSAGQYTFLAKLMEKSFLLKAYSKLMFFYVRPNILKPQLGGHQADIHAFDEFIPTPYRRNLEAMVEVLQENHIVPLLVTRPIVVTSNMTYEDLEKHNVFFPYYPDAYSIDRLLSLHQAYNKVVRDVADKYSVPFVDLDRIFDMKAKGDLFWDTMHPSDKGHELIAETLYSKIRCSASPGCERSDWLPEKTPDTR
jgi:lysophospholipase L1-like esterase